MLRTSIFVLLCGVGLAACASDDAVVVGYGAPGNKPSLIAASDHTSFVELQSPDSACAECAIQHDFSDVGETLTYLNPHGGVVCSTETGLDGAIIRNDCDAHPFAHVTE